MFNFWKRNRAKGLLGSSLHDEKSFYEALLRDMACCEREIIIESPYITTSRMEKLYSVFEKLILKGVKIHIITRDPIDHEDEYMRHQATNEILYSKELRIKITLVRGFHHRKLVFVDRTILWEGSLNPLSYTRSREIMRRIESKQLAKQMFDFLKLSRFI